jgi:phosphoribosyl 1,2-cyclic phosphate phosphodiesterase
MSSFHVTATVLGSGTSQGVPMIGCTCPVCRSTDPRDKRTRSSLFLDTPEAKLLIDTTPDLRQQALREGLDHVDAVLFTHHHADHVMGFDDLRRFCALMGKSMPIYGSPETLQQIERIFVYAFDPGNAKLGYVHVTPHIVRGPFTLGGLEITPLPVPHGRVSTYGYLFSGGGRKLLAYISDGKDVPAEARDAIRQVEVLLIDGLREQPHFTHMSIGEAVAVAQDVGAGQTYLTHQTHDRSHADRARDLPPRIDIAFDGMRIDFDVA